MSATPIVRSNRPVKVAIYSIALNEAKHAKRWAQTTRKADYRIVADTGSTDDTVKQLVKNGVTVHSISVQPWRFDVARNTALSLIPSDADVCLTLDMDELIDDDFVDVLRATWIPGKMTIGQVSFDTGSVWLANRVHARNGFVWMYPIHEVFVPSMGSEVVQVCDHADDHADGIGGSADQDEARPRSNEIAVAVPDDAGKREQVGRVSQQRPHERVESRY